MKSSITKIISSQSLLIFAILLFVSNFISKLVKEILGIDISIYPSTIVKMMGVLLLAIYFIVYLRKHALAKGIYILIGVFLLDFVIKLYQEASFDMLASRSYYFLKLLFFFLLLISIKDVKRETLDKTIRAFFVIAKINLIFIIIGSLCTIDLFKSYPYTARFGYNGIISEPGISSYFYMILAIIAYVKLMQKNGSWINLIVAGISLLLLGTKSALLFVAILVFVHLLIILKKNTYRFAFIAMLLTFFIVFRQKIIDIAINSFNFGPHIYEKYGLITFITSKRDLLFIDAMSYIKQHWNFLNYIIGGIDLKHYRVEFEFVDIFMFLGIIGLIVYIFMLLKVFFQKKQHVLYTVFFLTILLISSLGGNLFFSITNAFCFTVGFIYLRELCKIASNKS